MRLDDGVNIPVLGGDIRVGKALAKFLDFLFAGGFLVFRLIELALVDDVYSSFRTHDGDLGGGPSVIHVSADVNYAWPTAEIAVMGPEGAVNIVYKRELDQAKDKEAARKQKVEEFRERFANPYIAAENGYIDAVIQPHETRRRLIDALEMLQTKRDKNPPKKHGNMPL